MLFCLPGPTRENNLHHHLSTPSAQVNAGLVADAVVVATTTRTHCWEVGLTGPIWRLVGEPYPPWRLRLVDLPSLPGRPGPYHPGPPVPDEDPLHLLHPQG